MNSLKPVYICGASAISSWGFDWREMGQKLLDGKTTFAPAQQLLAFTDSAAPVIGSEVPDIPAEYDVEPRSRKFMSHSARLAAVALKLLLSQTDWSAEVRQDVAFYLGVGASGAAMSELEAMLAVSIQNHQFSVNDFGAIANAV
jgi:3-oxoacyl-(acyl-carrier-protein) synthase